MKVLNALTSPQADQRSWRVVYTRPRWEKKVDLLLGTLGIEAYCPLIREYRIWADRKKMVEIPLFSSYLFVHTNPKEEITVRQTLGVVNFVYFQGRPALLSSAEIERIRYLTNHFRDIEVVGIAQLSPGDRVLIRSGALKDQKGEVIRVHGKYLLMSLDHLGCVILTKVATDNIITL